MRRKAQLPQGYLYEQQGCVRRVPVGAGLRRVGLRFGNCNNDLTDGPRCLNLNNDAANANWNIGAA